MRAKILERTRTEEEARGGREAEEVGMRYCFEYEDLRMTWVVESVAILLL